MGFIVGAEAEGVEVEIGEDAEYMEMELESFNSMTRLPRAVCSFWTSLVWASGCKG